ncbi:immunoglobulin-like domain-containing protein [Plesiomonas sp.]|uniref:immunoglobulin-like domain-containing protein n=1 Tax=Plesiomonas sp. TaxID=2486279 RepID=UPI003F40C895
MKTFKNSLLSSSILFALSLAPGYATASSLPMVNPQSGVMVGYWHNFCSSTGYQGGNATCIKLSDINAKYNVVNIAFMLSSSNGAIPTFKLDTSSGISESQFIAQITELNNQGRAVLLSLGGAEGHIVLQTGQEQAFADEIIRLVDRYGFDGLDIDLESAAITAGDNQTVIPAALKLVKDHYKKQGQNFLITMAPEFPHLRSGSGYAHYITALEGYYDWINPQFYNQAGDGITGNGVWIAQNNDNLKKDFIYYMADALANGTGGYIKIPHNKLVFGIPSNIDAANNGYVQNPQDLFDAFAMLKEKGQPLRGIMTWSINWDMGKNAQGQSYNNKFINDYGDFIHGQNITPPEPNNGKPVFTGVNNTRIKQGSSFDPRSGVSVTDTEDGELTNFTVDGFVDTYHMGTYTLTYTATDKDGNETKEPRQVEVYNMKPILTGINHTTIDIGSSFDPLMGITASDEEDGDLTDKITMTGDLVNTNIAKAYYITYHVSDKNEQTTSQPRTVIVKKAGSICDNNWSPTTTYVGGDRVSYNGQTWQAGWWTKGETPGTTGQWGVWRLKGESDCNNVIEPPLNTDFSVTGITSSYPLTNGNVTIRFNISTPSSITTLTTLEKAGVVYGSTTNAINGSAQITLNGTNLVAGTHNIVIKDTKNGQSEPKRIPVTLTSSNGGGSNTGDYPAYQSGKTYKGGDKVTNNGGKLYECKPYPNSGWCGGSSLHYAPGTGLYWQEAWIAR